MKLLSLFKRKPKPESDIDFVKKTSYILTKRSRKKVTNTLVSMHGGTEVRQPLDWRTADWMEAQGVKRKIR